MTPVAFTQYIPAMASSQSGRTRENQVQFDRVAAGFFSAPLSFFEVLGTGLVRATGVNHGNRVLDLACGAGSSALPAARLVGRSGRVVGIDISRGMIDVAASRARAEGLFWVAFQQAAVEDLSLDERFDVALCGFAVHHFDDPATVSRAMARHLKPGGRWGLSLWADGFWEPHRTIFNDIVSKVRPDLAPSQGGRGRLHEPGGIESIAAEAGLRTTSVETVRHQHVLNGFDEYWHLVTTSGGRAVLSRVSADEARVIRDKLETAIAPYRDSEGRLTLLMAALFVTGER